MKRTFVAAVASAAMLFGAFAAPATADTIDAKAFSCNELTEALNSKSEDDQYGATVVLYWLHGYLATEEQGTVVDFDNMLKSFEKTAEYCSKSPNIGVMTASQKFMGDNEPAPGKDAIDLAILKCEKVTHSDKDDAQGLGQILMWLAGYHASSDEETVIDFAKFDKDTKNIGEYCSENQQVGFFTATEKFMTGDGSDGSDDSDAQ